MGGGHPSREVEWRVDGWSMTGKEQTQDPSLDLEKIAEKRGEFLR